MNVRTPRVMLVGESEEAASYLLYRLQAQGCECYFARSYEQARRLLCEQGLDLVLGPVPRGEEDVEALLGAFTAAKATLFCFHTVGDRCWWVPAVRRGRKCRQTPALQPSEFIAVLDATVREIKREVPTPRRPDELRTAGAA